MNILVSASLALLFAIGLGLAAAGGIRAAWRGLGRRRGVSAALAAFAVVATICAQKPGPSGPTITIDALLRDAGCYATNDVFHAAVSNAPAYAAIDFSACPVLVYARPRGLSDAPEWEELLPRRTFSELPADYAIEDATNYNYLVYLDYVPPSPVHTNGVFELHGFVIPGDEPGNLEQLAAGFINSRAIPPPPTARDYVQDGLIAMWDGIENAGWGTHDPNATTWTNLAQDKWHLWVNPVVVWTDNAARKPTMDGFNIATNGPALTAAEEALARAVELVVTWTGEWQHTGNSYNKVAILFNWGQAGNGGKTFFLSGTDGNRFSAQSRRASSTRYALSGPLSDIPVNQPFQLSADFAAIINARPTRFALNGVAVTDTSYIGRDGVAGITLGGPVAHHYYLLGDIHCVRVYDRALTAEEIAHNYKIDKERFGLP